MNFMFSWNIVLAIFISSSYRVMLFLLYRHINNGVFGDFPKISDHFPKISEDFPKLAQRSTISEKFPRYSKIPEDC